MNFLILIVACIIAYISFSVAKSFIQKPDGEGMATFMIIITGVCLGLIPFGLYLPEGLATILGTIIMVYCVIALPKYL